MALEEVSVELDLGALCTLLGLPSFKVQGKWKPSAAEREAAWELYVELVTRISVVELAPDEGLLREALSSLHPLFGITREILRRHGSAVAQPKLSHDHYSFGQLSVDMLNLVLRPVLSRWHPLLLAYEGIRPADRSPVDHEHAWQHNAELRQVLNETRRIMIGYANLLGAAAGAVNLITNPGD